jgi:hypothetical protein
MRNSKLAVLFAVLMSFTGNAQADGYSLPASVHTITIGSTGNWYFYVNTNPSGLIDYTPAFSQSPPPVGFGTPITHTLFNPAGCSSPTRYVLDRKAGNFRDVIDALKIFGIGGGSAFGPGGLAIGGLQFYVSSSTCVASSPKIVRIRYLPQLFGIPAGP